ncbi:c-type cytochrome [Vibrio zhugei]|uniref:C-type cytochrome n=1 Tax=Vibrio zhugei TaxID=2479546 RepID=A0ABV7C8N4_9VIBR|nr:cytochrome c [Vibrio zhugei]
MKTLIIGLGSLLTLLPACGYSADNIQITDKLIKQGEYMARASDCVACHTAPGGKPFAGGLAIDSPFGTIYSSNITPSQDHGIGHYSYQQFERALRQGIRGDGALLYPAMPYPDYAKLTDQDVEALYAYFMHAVTPVNQAAKKTDLSFPFNQRWGIQLWNWISLDNTPYQYDPAQSALYNRGAYLVQGPGHCGSCHTPRGLFYAETSYDQKTSDFLSGAMVGIWSAPEIRAGHRGALQHWSTKDITEYLATGRNQHSAVVGEMTPVIARSLSHLSDQDLTAIATYLKALPGKNSHQPESNDKRKKTTETLIQGNYAKNSAERLYADNCSACHFDNGQGAPKVFPALDGNSLVNAKDPSGLVHVILVGATLPSTPKAPEALAMPGFGWRLSNKEIAKLATFLRSGWSNNAPAVSAHDVAKIRKTLSKAALTKDKPSVD